MQGTSGKHFTGCQQDTNITEQLGERWQDAIMDLCDDELLFTQARNLPMHIC